MDIQPYLDRIHFLKKPEVSADVLFQLQKNHLLHVPFENLDIHYRKKIKLDPESQYTKIVENKRGGFCYELNSLFNELLKTIGFDSYLISARAFIENDTYGKEYDHMAVVVKLDGKSYLADVGFGKFTLEPLEIAVGVPQHDEHGLFIFDEYPGGYYRVSKLENNILTPEYIFTLKSRKLDEFEPMCEYHQVSPLSHFTRKKVISLARPQGRITLTNDTLKINDGDGTEIIPIANNEFNHYLQNYFNIHLKSDLAD